MATIPPFIPPTVDTLSAGGETPPAYFANFLRTNNIFCSSVSQAISGGLTIGSNVTGMRFPQTGWATLKTGPNYSTGTFPSTSFSWIPQAVKQPDEVRIGYCAAQNGSVGDSAVSIPAGGWSYNASTNVITIKYLTGLQNSTAYYITFLAQ